MSGSISKFLKTSLRCNLDYTSFKDVTNEVNLLIYEIKKVEDYLNSISFTNTRELNVLKEKFANLKTKYQAKKKLVVNNQDITARIANIEKRIKDYDAIITFAVKLVDIENKLKNIDDIDTFINEFDFLKNEYSRYQKVLERNESINDRYLILEMQVEYLKFNKETLTRILNDMKNLHITDRDYSSQLDKYKNHKKTLEGLFDRIFINRINEVINICEHYVEAINLEETFKDEVSNEINNIDDAIWDEEGYVASLEAKQRNFISRHSSSFLTKPYITSQIYINNETLLSSFKEKVSKVIQVVKKANKIITNLDSIRSSSDPTVVKKTIEKAETDYDKLKFKKNLPETKKKIEEYKGLANEIIIETARRFVERCVNRAKRASISSTLTSIKQELIDMMNTLDEDVRVSAGFEEAIEFIDKKIRQETRRDRFNHFCEFHSKKEFVYIFFVLFAAALLVGHFFYSKYANTNVTNWLFDNPPFFMHKWAHWGLAPWKWVESVKVTDLFTWLLMVLTFIVSIICMLLCLIAEVLWLIITLLAYAILWLLLSIVALLLFLLMYTFPAILLAAMIFITYRITVGEVVRPTFGVISCVLVGFMMVASYVVMANMANI